MLTDIINEVKGEILDQITSELYEGSVRQSATLIFLALQNRDGGERTREQKNRDDMKDAVYLALALDAELRQRLDQEE